MSRHKQRRRLRLNAGGRFGVVTLDQAVSGGSNVLALVIAARVLTPGEFGIFGLLFLIFGLVQGIFRSAVCTPVLMQPPRTDDLVTPVVRSVWLFGLASGSLLALTAVAAALADPDPDLVRGLAALAVCMPLLVIQDLCRFIAVSVLRPGYALVLDLTWLILFVACALLFIRNGESGPVAMLAIWGGSGSLTGLLAIALWRPLRAVRPELRWLATNWHLSWRFTVAYAAAQLSIVLLAFIVREMLGAVTLGALLGAQLLMRPYSVVETAVLGSGVAEIANTSRGRRDIMRHVKRVTVVAAAIALTNAIAMVVLPDSIGAQLLGDTWPRTSELVLPFALQLIALALSIGPRVGLVGADRVNLAVVLSVAYLPVLIAGSVAGAILGDALGFAWAATAIWFTVALMWWVAMYRVQQGQPE